MHPPCSSQPHCNLADKGHSENALPTAYRAEKMSLQKRVKQDPGRAKAVQSRNFSQSLVNTFVGRVGASAKKGKCAESDGEGKTLGESERVGGRMDERSGALARCRDN